MNNLKEIYENSTPVNKEDFRMIVETWNSKGHEHVVRSEFDDDTGELILVVNDYVDPDRAYYLKATPWSEDVYYDHT